MDTDPIIPMTQAQWDAQKATTVKEGILHKDLVAIDIAANVIVFHGQEDETISSHSARAAEQGKRWGRWMSKFLNLFQKNHGAKAQAGDVARAEIVEQLEEKSGVLTSTSTPNSSPK